MSNQQVNDEVFVPQFTHNLKISDDNQKGEAKITVTMHGNSFDIIEEAVKTFVDTKNRLKNNNIKVTI